MFGWLGQKLKKKKKALTSEREIAADNGMCLTDSGHFEYVLNF